MNALITKLRIPVNFVGYQASWFACVLGGNEWAIPVVFSYLAWHLLIAQEGEWRLILAISAGGILLDNLWYQLGFTQFPAGTAFDFIPVWLVLLWLGFSATLLHSMNFFFRRPWLIALFASFGAPLSYFAGTRFDAISMTLDGYIALSIGCTLLMYLAAKYHGHLLPRKMENAIY